MKVKFTGLEKKRKEECNEIEWGDEVSNKCQPLVIRMSIHDCHGNLKNDQCS